MMKSNPKISVDLVESTYKISDGKFQIFAIVDKHNRLTLRTFKGRVDFVFIASEAEIAKGVIKLMSEATKLLKSEVK